MTNRKDQTKLDQQNETTNRDKELSQMYGDALLTEAEIAELRASGFGDAVDKYEANLAQWARWAQEEQGDK